MFLCPFEKCKQLLYKRRFARLLIRLGMEWLRVAEKKKSWRQCSVKALI